ncbi:hypothetical protein AK812_SmicGene25765 [Symbiodinium microadriaticum]|uniref:Uncharacterized protein n=1 Tax=Symbiodinium microadriaticum TaxID=2951 RepID=A0A1Q9DBF0_SYMMI|nr:hypothetical protein AK812_SmicGene25765 [Symbiodinium microadriaticum]
MWSSSNSLASSFLQKDMLEVCGATCLLRASIELSLARGALVSLHKASLQRLLLKTDGLQRLGTMESDEALARRLQREEEVALAEGGVRRCLS